MAHHSCNNCTKCKNLQKKVELYEKLMSDMKALDEHEQKQYTSNNPLLESVIIEKDNYGNINKKVKSDLTESFLIIDHGKNLSELPKREQQVITEQDSYYKYKKTTAYFEKAKGISGAAYYALSIGKWLLLI